MDEHLEAWIAECVNKGTFASRADAIEFCVGATRAFCEVGKINQETTKKSQREAIERGESPRLEITFPLKWSEGLDAGLREAGRPPNIPAFTRPEP